MNEDEIQLFITLPRHFPLSCSVPRFFAGVLEIHTWGNGSHVELIWDDCFVVPPAKWICTVRSIPPQSNRKTNTSDSTILYLLLCSPTFQKYTTMEIIQCNIDKLPNISLSTECSSLRNFVKRKTIHKYEQTFCSENIRNLLINSYVKDSYSRSNVTAGSGKRNSCYLPSTSRTAPSK